MSTNLPTYTMEPLLISLRNDLLFSSIRYPPGGHPSLVSGSLNNSLPGVLGDIARRAIRCRCADTSYMSRKWYRGLSVFYHYSFAACSHVSQLSQPSQVHVVPVLFETLVTDVTLLQTGHTWMIANIVVFQRPDYRLQRSNSGW